MSRDWKENNNHADPGFQMKPGTSLLIVMAIAGFARLWNLAQSSLWTDELASYWVITAGSIRECALRAIETQGQSPFFYLVERMFLSMVTHNEWTLRFPSTLCSVLSVWAIYHLARLMFKNQNTGLVAALIFALHEVQIYYAQEARPYAMAILFILLSHLYFLHWMNSKRRLHYLLYVLSSICLAFSHYIFVPLFLIQNLWYYYAYRECDEGPEPKLWLRSQGLIALAIVTQAPQLLGMFGGRAKWNWVPEMSITETLEMFLGLFNIKVLALMLFFFLLFLMTERVSFYRRIRDNRRLLLLLLAWWLLPFVIVVTAHRLFGISLFDQRYLLLSLIPYYLLLARVLCLFDSNVLRTTFPGAFIVLYLGMILIPNYVKTGMFAPRPFFNWRGALAFVEENSDPDDAVILRTGFVKENWVPGSDNKRIIDYPKAPFYSFYWKEKPKPEIYTLTYTWEERFYPYYDSIFTAAKGHPRVWLIGVNPPGTNYDIARINGFLEKEYPMICLYQANFNGVFLSLLSVMNYEQEIPEPNHSTQSNSEIY